MKTKNFIPTLLALTIRVMVIGQTHNSESTYRILNVLGGKQPSSPSMTVAKKKVLKEKSDALLNDKSAQPVSALSLNSAITIKEQSIITAQQHIEQLIIIEDALRNQAFLKKGQEKQTLLVSANQLHLQIEIKQIEASELSGKASVELFNANEKIFNSILYQIKNESSIESALDLNGEAKHTMKLAKEMREEAYSLSNNSARLGTMVNAEEKETLALDKLELALGILKKSLALNTTTLPDLAGK
ncbi:MAG: hypothetical protein JWO32_671 [Bacteroidetes bacterium]|nr:hypothetical protein [Bacteroidota bacterium]